VQQALEKQAEFSKLFLPDEGVLNLNQTAQQLERLFQHKETILIGEQLLPVTKYHFKHIRELQQLNTRLDDILKHFELQQITIMQQSMTKEVADVRLMQNK
jgi:sulfur relay (sulfurtransferase) complex TusBCD TusD component (DsrE family)